MKIPVMGSPPSEHKSLPSMAGVKRPAPCLLPAFEPLSSSPPISRSAKRQACISTSNLNRGRVYQKYPTPIPTSTTGFLSSSPPQTNFPRPNLQQAQFSVSERTPLSTVTTIRLPANGDELLLGRSSNSCHHRLSTNHLISRIHIKAQYVAATTPLESEKVVILCCGWNGAKVHSNGQTWELAKGDTFTSEAESAEIMLDVQDARVLIAWPFHDKTSPISTIESSWDDENSPKARVGAVNSRGQPIQSSPLQMGHRMVSPESPTPAGRSTRANVTNQFSDVDERSPVQVYEDESSDNAPDKSGEISDSLVPTQVEPQSYNSDSGQSSELSELSEPEDDKDPDEENDPIIHSFGPFGANISSRLANFGASSPTVPRCGLSRQSSASPAGSSGSRSTNDADPGPIVNHVVNQLAFSRLSSTPLSVILSHLPTTLKRTSPTQVENQGLTKEDLQKVLSAVPCIGEINREGKDAAGKPLESEYYYIPDEDRDEQRRATVVEGLRKPSLRSCRKQHKQYYWKRPRTP